VSLRHGVFDRIASKCYSESVCDIGDVDSEMVSAQRKGSTDTEKTPCQTKVSRHAIPNEKEHETRHVRSTSNGSNAFSLSLIENLRVNLVIEGCATISTTTHASSLYHTVCLRVQSVSQSAIDPAVDLVVAYC
jgi:hypothetical protein